MYYIVPVFVFIFGTLVGSFLNVVIYRHNTGRTLGGRSGCLTCARTLEWYELVPIFSFLFLKGRCRKCTTPISPMYPVVEFLTGVVFLFIFARFAFFLPAALPNFIFFTSFYAVLFSLLIVIAGYDLRHKIIPDTLSYAFILFSFLGLFLSDYGVVHFHPATLTALLGGVVVALPLFILFAISRGRWLGFGDVKLALGIGLMLGISRGLSALVLSFWIGAIIGIIMLILKKRNVSMKSEIPFAPFLVLGTMIAFFFDVHLFGLMSVFAF